jgi:serine/threonine protein kinase
LSQLVPKEEKMTKVCGTWAYAAPEMSDPHSGGYDCKYDTWGFGVILFVVLSGYHPFDPEGGLPVAEIKARARAARFDFEQPEWDVVSETAKDLLRKLIVKDPAVTWLCLRCGLCAPCVWCACQNRLDSGQLLKHPWFTADVSNLPIAPDMGNKISAYQQRFVDAVRCVCVCSLDHVACVPFTADENSRRPFTHRSSWQVCS